MSHADFAGTRRVPTPVNDANLGYPGSGEIEGSVTLRLYRVEDESGSDSSYVALVRGAGMDKPFRIDPAVAGSACTRPGTRRRSTSEPTGSSAPVKALRRCVDKRLTWGFALLPVGSGGRLRTPVRTAAGGVMGELTSALDALAAEQD